MGVAMSTEHASVRFLPVSATLQGLVTAYYVVEVRGPPGCEIEDLLHPEWGNLRFGFGPAWSVGDHLGQLTEAPGAVLFGPTSRARRIVARPGLSIGVGLTPIGWASLVQRSAGPLADQLEPAELSFGAAVEALHADLEAAADDGARAGLIDAFLIGRRAPAPVAAMQRMIDALAEPGVRTVAELAARAGMSEVTATRACVRWFGFPAKLLLRRQRFLRTLDAVFKGVDTPLSELIDQAYADQSHFNREFKRMMGFNPKAYLRRPRPILTSAAANRERALGAALQGLHRIPR